MKKLELKHLAPYLPYKLRIYVATWKCEREIKSLHQSSIMTEKYHNILDFEHIKPILRPLSDLTKEIEHNEKKYLGNGEFSENEWTDYKITKDILRLDYNSINELIKRHFDVFNLIEKELAIDINTL